MRRDLIALITLAFALGFPSPGFPQTWHQHNRNANNEKGGAACYHWLLANSAILKELLCRPTSLWMWC